MSPTIARLWRRLAGITLIAVAAGTAAWWPRPAAAADCSPVGPVKFICGVRNVEDFAPLSGTHWVVGSDLVSAGQHGHLYLFDTRNDAVTAVDPSRIAIRPDKVHYPDCPGAPEMAFLESHGLGLSRGQGLHRTLYVINHGGRDSVEVFDIDLSQAIPRFTWKGCAVAPKGFWPDGVAALPEGRLVVTSLWNPNDPMRDEKLTRGAPIGAVDVWSAKTGWMPLPGSAGLSGPNGVLVSPDGHEIYVALWSGRAVARISFGNGAAKRDVVPTGMLTDNLRWTPDGKMIFVGGQVVHYRKGALCPDPKSANCALPFRIDIMNPKTLKLATIVKSGVYGKMGAGTGAIEVGHELWVSSFRADRIARFPVARLPRP